MTLLLLLLLLPLLPTVCCATLCCADARWRPAGADPQCPWFDVLQPPSDDELHAAAATVAQMRRGNAGVDGRGRGRGIICADEIMLCDSSSDSEGESSQRKRARRDSSSSSSDAVALIIGGTAWCRKGINRSVSDV